MKAQSWRSFSLLIALAIAELLAGCAKQTGVSTVAAKVNGQPILTSEVDRNYNVQIAGAQQKINPLEEESIRLNVIDHLITEQLMLQRAKKLGIAASNDEVDSKLKQAKGPYTNEEFVKKLKDVGFTEDDYTQELRRSLTVNKLLEKEVSAKVNLSDAEIQSYYDQNKAQFNVPEAHYMLARIYISNQPSGVAGAHVDRSQLDADAKRRMQMVRARLDSGEDFTSLAQKYSQDGDGNQAPGTVQQVPASQVEALPAILRDAILKLKPGDSSAVLPAVDPRSGQTVGYQIIRFGGKTDAGQRELNDPQVQQFIRNKLRGDLEKVLKTAYDEELHDNAEIRNFYAEEVLKKHGTK